MRTGPPEALLYSVHDGGIWFAIIVVVVAFAAAWLLAKLCGRR